MAALDVKLTAQDLPRPGEAAGQITFPNRNAHETISESRAPLGVSHAHFAPGPPLFRTAAHQKSRIHTDGSDLVGARHWSGHRCIQRDLCGA